MTRVGWYVASRLAGDADAATMLGAGPFPTRETAAEFVEPMKALADADPSGASLFLEFGTASVELDWLGTGPANARLGLSRIGQGFVTRDADVLGGILDATVSP